MKQRLLPGGLAALLGITAALAIAPPAAAQDAREARALFRQGMQHAEAERWVAALESFRASLAFVDRPSTRINIGSVLVRLGRHLEARELLLAFLAEDPSRADRQQAEAILELARDGIRLVTVLVEPADAEVVIDGHPVAGEGEERTLEVDPGEHELEVRATGFVAERHTIPPGLERLEVRLLSMPAVLTVRASIAEALIALNGREEGRGEARIQLAAGRHLLLVTADDHDSFERWLELSPGQRLDVVANLSRSEREALLESPWLWIAVGAAVLLGVGIAIGVATTSADYDGGSLEFVLQP